ncbi:MAG: TlpA family protein disulfide reductase [Bacteroidales bacterium]|nr:TlpA family protein disulfide reductase [Bacteroidales bacterium]
MKLKIGLIFTMSLFVTLSVQGQSQKSQAKEQKENLDQQIQTSTLIKIGEKAPDFTVTMLNGKKYTLSELRGKVVLVNFWATWCPPCMREFTEIPNHIIEPFAGNKNFVFLPISRGESQQVVDEKMEQLKKQGISFNVGLDPDKKIYSNYATAFIPRNFLIDQKGNVVYFSVGYTPKSMSDLVAKIHELLSAGSGK